MTNDLITIAELDELSGSGQVRAVDCRFDLFDTEKGRIAYLEAHIPGAVYADLDKDLAGPVGPATGRHPLPDADVFRAALADWGIGHDTLVVAYDFGNGALAARLWWMLKFWLGHEQVAVLDGGFDAWTAAGFPVEGGVVKPVKAQFSRPINAAAVASTKEIAATVQAGGKLSLLDAREKVRFDGEKEPIDRVAGHVPGAVNMPLGLSLGQDGKWLPPDALGELWRESAVQAAEDDVIAMCGSGVTACHLILSAVLAGLPPPRLYVGSWSEWICDPERPVERVGGR